MCGLASLGCDHVHGCLCEEGWTGTNCDTDVNECDTPDVCNDVNKVCTNALGSYTCTCRDGFIIGENDTCVGKENVMILTLLKD